MKKIRLFLIIITPTLAGLLIFSKSPEATERIYSAFLYPGITWTVTLLFGWLPFSLSEMIIILILPALLALIIQIARKKIKFLRGLYLAIICLCLLFSWFYLSWGFNYLRQPMTQRLQISSDVADSTLIKQALQEEIDHANASYLVYENFNRDRIDEKVEKGYKIVARQLGIKLPGGLRKPKRMLIHAILNKTMTSGIFSPLFHEVHVNEELLPIEYPFILAHEKAHQMGIANEAEANFLAYLVCTATPDQELNYSAHFSQLGKLLRRAYRSIADYDYYRRQVRPEINADYKRVQAHWLKHAGVVADFSHKAYDKYLKANRIQEGIKNYAGDIDMLIWWKLKQDTLNPAENKKAGSAPAR